MNFIDDLSIMLVIIPLLAALINVVVGQTTRRYAWHISTTATSLSFLVSLLLLNIVLTTGKIEYQLGGWESPWGIVHVIDYLNGFIVVIVSFIALAVSIYAGKSVKSEIEENRTTMFYSIYLLFIAGLFGILVTGDIFNLYVFIEIASISGYALIAVGRKRDALLASYNYLILGTIAATFILIGIGYLYMATGTLNMADLRERLPLIYESKVVLTAFAFFTVGLSLKMALFPLHTWLPNAYTYAPSVVSSIMAATATKVGAYAMLRIMFTVFTPEFDLQVVPVTKILIVVSVIAVIAGSVLAIAQTSIKRMLAYSSVGQIGYIVLGMAVANQAGMTGSLLHILNHALMKGTLFLAAGAVVYRLGVDDISALKGLGKKMPLTMAAFTVGALSMIGVPLSVGFISKWYISMGAIHADMWFIVPAILISSLLTAVYFWRIIESIYFAEPVGKLALDKLGNIKAKVKNLGSRDDAALVTDAPFGMLAPTLVLAGLCIVFGIAAFIPISVAGKAATMLLGGA